VGKQKKLTHKRRNRRTEKPKRRWAKYAILASLAIITGLGIAYRPEKKPDPVETRQAASYETVKIPPASIKLIREKSGPLDPGFREVNGVIDTYVRKADIYKKFLGTTRKIGKEEDVPTVLQSIKKKLDSQGHKITSSAKTPQEIFEALRSYFMENRMWIAIGTSLNKNKYLWRVPIESKASITFSFFEGKMKGKDFPVYFLKEVGEDYGIPDAFTTKNGSFICIDALRDTSKRRGIWIDLEKYIEDAAIHEAVHYFTGRRFSQMHIDEYDINKEPDKKLMEEDELRALLIQMIYGNYPKITRLDIGGSRDPHYEFARQKIIDSFTRILNRKYWEYGEILLNTRQVRELSYLTFIKHFNHE